MPKDNTPAAGDNDKLLIEFPELVAFLDELKQKKKAVDEATGSLRARIKAILEDQGFHPQALAMIRQIEAMSESKRADFLRTFDPMFEAMYEGKWAQENRDLLDGLENTDPDSE